MNASSFQFRGRGWRWLLFALLISLAAITRQSLWNDEALTAVKAMQPTLGGWWHEMVADKASDLQMPLYMIYMWGFAKIFGISEWALRGANIPWFVLGIWAFLQAQNGKVKLLATGSVPHDTGAAGAESIKASRQSKAAPLPSPLPVRASRGEGEDRAGGQSCAFVQDSKKIALAVVALVSPFAWYYLSEARPYAVQLGASLMIFAALYRLQINTGSSLREEALNPEGEVRASSRRLQLVGNDCGWVAIFFCGVIALSGSSLLGMIWAGAACLAAWWTLGLAKWARLGRAHIIICAVSFCALAALAGYYLWTLKQGARASDVGRTDGRNLMFIIYELLGLGGLGPGRLEIRDEGLRAFVPYAKWLFPYGVLIGDLLILGCWRIYRGQPRVKLIGIIFIIALPMMVILGTGYVKEFRVLGRHFTPLLAVFLLVLGTGLQARWCRPHWASKPMVCAFFILSLASCLSFRLAVRHERDDYRDAAVIAKAALQTGRGVWWNAGREGALYYGLPLANAPGQKDAALWLMNPAPDVLSKLPPPELIVTSKPDVYDARGAVGATLIEKHYFKFASMPAFSIWERKVGGVRLASEVPAHF